MGIRFTPTAGRAALLLTPLLLGAASALAQDAAPAPAPSPVPPAAPAVLPYDLSPLGMFLAADLVVKSVLLILVAASLATWTVAIAKAIELRRGRRRLQQGLAALGHASGLDEAAELLGHSESGVAALLVDAARDELAESGGLAAAGIKERLRLRVARIEAGARHAIGRGTGILASIGATAPFVGLFGTVWGIMNSFVGISKAHTTNLAVVAPGIAEALLATAFGLAAAIPAVLVYNAFARQAAGYRRLLADAASAVERLTSRDLDRRGSETVSLRRLRAAE